MGEDWVWFEGWWQQPSASWWDRCQVWMRMVIPVARKILNHLNAGLPGDQFDVGPLRLLPLRLGCCLMASLWLDGSPPGSMPLSCGEIGLLSSATWSFLLHLLWTWCYRCSHATSDICCISVRFSSDVLVALIFPATQELRRRWRKRSLFNCLDSVYANFSDALIPSWKVGRSLSVFCQCVVGRRATAHAHTKFQEAEIKKVQLAVNEASQTAFPPFPVGFQQHLTYNQFSNTFILPACRFNHFKWKQLFLSSGGVFTGKWSDCNYEARMMLKFVR